MHAYLFSGQQLAQKMLTISANTPSYVAYSAAGSPTYPCAVTVTINAGVTVGGGGTETVAAFRTGGWPSGTTFLLINYGAIRGKGGDANRNGGDAMSLSLSVTIDNRGTIWGGGGGGASGPNEDNIAGGGGGGGGAGYPGGTGGSGGLSGSDQGASGGNGSTTAAGGGGAGKDYGITGIGGDGGNGGYYGQAGSPSGSNSPSGQWNNTQGAGGRAITLNGHSVNWVSGSSYPAIRGAVA